MVELFVFLILQYQTTLKINSIVTLYETRVDDNYNILYQLSHNFVDVTFNDIANQKEVVSNLTKANQNKENSDILTQTRAEIYKLLADKYKSLQKVGIVQFHFVLDNGDSFFRFHDTEKYGDNLLNFRESIKYVTQYKTPVSTFETGKIFSGYRFVYPIFDTDKHFIGSVEISYKIDHIINHFEKNFFKTLFIEDKKSISDKLFDDINHSYNTFALHENFLVRKDIISKSNYPQLLEILSTKIDQEELTNNINSEKSFSFYFKNKSNYDIVHFKAIKHSITNKLLGYVILSSQISEIKDFILIFYIGFIIVSFFIIVLFLYFYTLNKAKKKIQTILTSEEKLLKKVDQNVIYAKSDISGNIIEVSQAFCDTCGYTKQELIGKKFKIFRHPDMPSDVFKDLWSTIASGNTWQREIKNLAKDGSFYWIRLTIQPDFDNNGKIESYTAISQNITNRKRIESIYRDLRFQVERYNAIFDNANSGIGTIDLNGYFIQANNKFAELLNLPLDTTLNTNLLDCFDQNYKQMFEIALDKVKLGQNINKLEVQYQLNKHTMSFIEMSLNLLPDGKSIVVIANSLDDKINLQQTLEFNKTLLYAIPLPIFIQDKELKLVECNKAFLEFFNLSKDVIIGTKVNQILGKNLEELVPKELANLYKDKDSEQIEKTLSMYQTKIKNHMGIDKTIEIYKTTYNYKNEFNGIIGVMVDISTKEAHTTQLQQTIAHKTLENIKQTKDFEQERLRSIKFQAIGQLAAGITHEINTPLTFAKGNLEMMLYDINDLPPSQLKDNLLQDSTSVMGGLNRIANIVESMREMSQQSKEIKEPTNIYSTLLVALTMAHNRAKIITKIYINNQEFEIGMDKNQFSIISNVQKQRIEQVWVIIINNALDELVKIDPFEKRYLDIKTQVKDGFNIIYFRDNAGGIPEHILDTLFQPFVSNKDSSGMGIGLNIAQKILRDNGGEIKAYNDEFGAIFEVRLPCI